MEAKVDQLAATLRSELQNLPEGKRLLVGICGIPGSGKSSLARRVADRLNHATAEPVAIVIGMDGWHYTRQQLSLFDDPKHAFDRRGAEFTFDSSRFADFVVQLGSIKDHTVKAPSFDHAKKDPLEDDIQVLPQHRVALIEGLYCNCNVEHWKRAAEVLHHRWVCLISRDEAKRRLVARHVATGVAKDEAEAIWRAGNNDLPNGDWLMQHLLEPYTIVESIEESSWS